MAENILPIQEGYSGKSHILHCALIEVIDRPEFRDMTLAELTGTLEILKLSLVLHQLYLKCNPPASR